MPPFSLENACYNLVEQIRAKGFTIDESALQDDPDLYDTTSYSAIGRTLLYGRCLDYFGNHTLNWLERLTSTSFPHWHVITINPEESPLQAEDWILAAPSLLHAFEFIVTQMHYTRATLKSVLNEYEAKGRIIFQGAAGRLATIEKIQFHEVDPISERRAINALRGLLANDTDTNFAKCLGKIHGLDKMVADSDTDPTDLQCLHVTCANLCISMQSLLKETVREAVSNSLAQELVANFFGFQSWNHFKGAEKRRLDALYDPCYVAQDFEAITMPQSVSFYRQLPAALHSFGARLNRQSRKQFSAYGGHPACFTNLSFAELNSGRFYNEDEGLRLKQMSVVESTDKDMLYLAATLLDSPSLEVALKNYLFVDCDEKTRFIQMNARDGVNANDNVFIDDWVFWVRRSDRLDGYFGASRISELGKWPKKSIHIGSPLHKAAIVKADDGGFWLATDWDREPVFHLNGLTDSDVALIEKRLLDGKN